MEYWLIKSEPVKYPWDQFVKEGKTFWDGVRNYTARNNLKLMQKGDLCLFYHSNEGLEIVGIAKVAKTAYQDPTTDDSAWVAVDFVPFKKLKRSVTLAEIKKDEKLQNMQLIKQSRLSVSKVAVHEFDHIMYLSNQS